jgi:lipid II isoglutaminyl synthase (glutamine-hydrolysing)
MTDPLRIGLILPDVLGTYGDSGNAVILKQRLQLRGIQAEIIRVGLDQPVPESLDLYILGGAEDHAQRLATKHLLRYRGLQSAAARGAPVLAICAAMQILGSWYETAEGERIEGIGLLDISTTPQAERCIGEIVSTPLIDGIKERLTGFENHRGGTALGSEAKPLGAVLRGIGNQRGNCFEGVVQGKIVASYLHGPCLARNPQLADLLLSWVAGQLPPLHLPEVEALRRERLATGGRLSNKYAK